jgi:SynChlorMet cassette protein ScmD
VSEEKKPIANATLVLREEFDDWAILFDPDTGTGYGLNPVAVLVWKHLDGRHSQQDIARIIEENCEDVPQDVLEHVIEFIDTLSEKGFVGYEVSGA